MRTVTNQVPATSAAHSMPVYPTMEQVTRPTVPTDQAAYYLNRQPQTLRAWSCLQPSGGIRPIKINGRLAWRTDDIRKLLSGEAV